MDYTIRSYQMLKVCQSFGTIFLLICSVDCCQGARAFGLRNWINQIFQVEMEWFDVSMREEELEENELILRPTQCDGLNRHLT